MGFAIRISTQLLSVGQREQPYSPVSIRIVWGSASLPRTTGFLDTEAASPTQRCRWVRYSDPMATRLFALGKWHVTPRSGNHNAGEKGSWPLQRGFDRFYGLLDGRTNALAPHLLFEDNHVLEIDEYPEGYLLSDDITDQAISMIRSVKAADTTKPFFLYLAHTAPHSPLVAHARDIHKYRDRYKEGWDRIREERFSRQLKEGLFPEHTTMAPRNSETDFDVPAWADLTETQQQVFARYMEVYAAMVDNIDQNLGRLCGVLSELDELDNTVFIFTSDNGASREGGSQGTTELERHIWTVFMRLESESEHLKRDFRTDGPDWWTAI